MATTRAFRARPLDIHKPLDIVRDLNLLDSTEGLPAREVVHNHAALDAENEKPKMVKVEGGVAKEIPIPGVVRISTYRQDYVPTCRERNTYIRPKGSSGAAYSDPNFVEYDMDSEDEKWLQAYNDGQERLPEERFELMIWKLEVSNAAATDHALSFAGAAPAERMSTAACATTDHLPREDALAILEEWCQVRDTTRVAVYDYWLAKRRQRGKPLLRRLHAPTPITDSNPYNVFRPREKVHRPQTRRRRENNEDSLEKMKMIQANVHKGLDLFEMLVKRERKKRDLVYVETDMQQLQIKLRHESRSMAEKLEGEYLAAAKRGNVKRPVGFDLPDAAPATTNALLDYKNSKKNKKRKKLGEVPIMNAVAALPPPPLPPQHAETFAIEPDITRLSLRDHDAHLCLPKGFDYRECKARIGRGGRLIFDRCKPFSPFEPSTPDLSGEGNGGPIVGNGDAIQQAAEQQQADLSDALWPMWELPNPYTEWLGKSELAHAALQRFETDPDGATAAAGASPQPRHLARSSASPMATNGMGAATQLKVKLSPQSGSTFARAATTPVGHNSAVGFPACLN